MRGGFWGLLWLITLENGKNGGLFPKNALRRGAKVREARSFWGVVGKSRGLLWGLLVEEGWGGGAGLVRVD